MKLIINIIIILVLFILYVKYLEKATIFIPGKQISYTPKDIGLAFEDVYFKTEDGIELNGWFIPNKNATSTMLYFHGNAGNISDRLDKLKAFYMMSLNVFIIDYRGYGKSKGTPSEAGLYKDALGAYDYLLTRKDINKDMIIGYGDSLGGAALIDLATKRNFKALIIDSSFTSARDMAKKIIPFVPGFLISAKLDSASKIKTVQVPKLFLHAKTDTIVPFPMGWTLFGLAVEPKEFVELYGDHNDDRSSDELFIKSIENFLIKNKLIR